MRRPERARAPAPAAWGLETGPAGDLQVQGVSCVALARDHGTPLHVVNEPRLEATASAFRTAFERAYPGPVAVHYAMKCNAVPAVVAAVKRGGLAAEVMTPFELDLALRLGYEGADLIVNGPGKTEAFLRACIAAKVRYVIVDALAELTVLERLGAEAARQIDVLLRVNPDYVPRGMNAGSATGSRKGCAFGLDLVGGEVEPALRICARRDHLRFAGFHLHVGTGIGDPRDYARALRCLDRLIPASRAAGLGIDVLDVGGGFAVPTSRELTGREMLLYQGLGRFPRLGRRRAPAIAAFARAIAGAIRRRFAAHELPTLMLEPGRSIASPNQLLLLGVHRVKHRPGAGTWIVTDGGLGTVSMPTWYEVHEVLLADDLRRPPRRKATVIGPVCFASDVVVRNKRLPDVHPGEVLAVMDSGAYFTALESSFGFPRPAVVAVSDGHARCVRRRETHDEMLARDELACPVPPGASRAGAATTRLERERCSTPS